MLKTLKILFVVLATLGIVGCGSGETPSVNPGVEQKDLREFLTTQQLFSYGGSETQYLIYRYSADDTYVRSFMNLDDGSLIEEDTFSYSIIGGELKYNSPLTDKEVVCKLEESTDKYIDLKCEEDGDEYSMVFWYILDDLKENYDL